MKKNYPPKGEFYMYPQYDEEDNLVGFTTCEAYGMCGGCDENCPVLIASKCELQDTDNKELYELAKQV